MFDIIVGDSSAAPKDPHTGLKIVAAAPFGLVMVIILLTSIADYILLFHALGRILLKPTQRVTAIAGAALVCSLGICGLLAFFPSYMDRYAIESIMAAFFLCGAVLFILPRLGNRGHHASVHE